MKLIHVAQSDKGWMFLQETSPGHYQWFQGDEPTEIQAPSIQEAIRLGWKAFASQNFEPLLCGYKYTLPERDEHGAPTLFSDMVQSLNTPTGQYFDPASGHNYIVQNIPTRARELYKNF